MHQHNLQKEARNIGHSVIVVIIIIISIIIITIIIIIIIIIIIFFFSLPPTPQNLSVYPCDFRLLPLDPNIGRSA
jgi:hypothetical protein